MAGDFEMLFSEASFLTGACKDAVNRRGGP